MTRSLHRLATVDITRRVLHLPREARCLNLVHFGTVLFKSGHDGRGRIAGQANTYSWLAGMLNIQTALAQVRHRISCFHLRSLVPSCRKATVSRG